MQESTKVCLTIKGLAARSDGQLNWIWFLQTLSRFYNYLLVAGKKTQYQSDIGFFTSFDS
jgi:hypothetical protein|tara:strand:- start:97 stop:276 length:180 start_codon:yes stop_codon:yes gene_type:complete